jgi:monovalent cation:H+ antiporter-2, CPA2 family
MPHDETTLISTIAVSLAYALLGGFVASRLRLSPIVGYLLAGIAVGPFTPGFAADAHLAEQLAEIGVVLLMFGVGMHFSLRELLAVWRIAVLGAILQMAATTALGATLAVSWGWPIGAAVVFGIALSIASTVVLLRALDARGSVRTEAGEIAVGWLVVEDLAMVLAMVLLPPLVSAPPDAAALAWDLALTLAKVAIVVALMLVVGARVLPWLLDQVERTGSRELFTLSVVAAALGIGFGASEFFGVSYALGAFLAGTVIAESDHSHRAALDSQPLQDAFSVLFFVGVGMLFDPAILAAEPLKLLAVLAVIMAGKGLVAVLIVLVFRYPLVTALSIGASIAQIGEFSFVIAALGLTSGLLPEEGHSLIFAGALISITLNPLLFRLVPRPASRGVPAPT